MFSKGWFIFHDFIVAGFNLETFACSTWMQWPVWAFYHSKVLNLHAVS